MISKKQKLLTEFFPRKSTLAWVVLGAYIFSYDVIAMALSDLDKKDKRKYETFSDGCWRGVEHPIIRWPIWFVILVLVKHLAMPNFLREYDPIGLVGKIVNFIKKRARYA